MTSTPAITLNNGGKMPAIGLGYVVSLDASYQTSGYQNEEHTGKAIRESGVPRSEIFLTTELGNGRRVYRQKKSPTYVETWKEMENLLDTGKVKSIGVSNFSIKTLDVLLAEARIVSAIQMHPCLPQQDLVKYSADKGIHITSYSPLGQSISPFFGDETIKRVAEKAGITVVKLDDEDYEAVDNLHKQPGMNRHLIFSTDNLINGKRAIFGWTYEQLGWEYE
ncbi:hypothetical protein FRB90_012765 [Tulasnella sp. 427]|nr:hypothetical protein FRB90_012765 [Tulasnella sp. 427]